MLNTINTYIITLFVISASIGYLPIILQNSKFHKALKYSQFFSMGMLVGLAITHLLPESMDTGVAEFNSKYDHLMQHLLPCSLAQ